MSCLVRHELRIKEGSEKTLRTLLEEAGMDCLRCENADLAETELSWYKEWQHNDIPAIAVSKRFPEVVFEYELYYDAFQERFLIQNGEFSEVLQAV